MRSDPAEYKPIIKKLLQKTHEGKVQWQTHTPSFGEVQYLPPTDYFEAIVGSESGDSVSFTITANRNDSIHSLAMKDHGGNEIFLVNSNDLPTSPDEEELSMMLDDLYEVARRQALKVDQKLELASSLLDRV